MTRRSRVSDAYVEAYHRAAVVEARESNSRERLQLFQLALLKLALNLVDSELSALRLKLDDARSLPARQLSGQSLQTPPAGGDARPVCRTYPFLLCQAADPRDHAT